MDVPNGDEYPIAFCFLHFDQLWLSVMPFFSKKGIRYILIHGYKNRYLLYSYIVLEIYIEVAVVFLYRSLPSLGKLAGFIVSEMIFFLLIRP